MNARPRLTAPVQTFPETHHIIDNKFGRPAGTYSTLEEAKTSRRQNRARYQIDSRPAPCFRAGPCSWCGWTSRVHLVKTAAAGDARQHRAMHQRTPGDGS